MFVFLSASACNCELDYRMAERPSFLKLSCAVQTYAWGKVGENGEVAKLKMADPGFSLDKEKPYAEVMMM